MKSLIIGITSFVAIVGADMSEGEELKDRVKADLNAIALGMESYKTMTGQYPTPHQGVRALVEKPEDPPSPRRWLQLLAKVPVDPWGRSYQYELKDGQIRLWSKGPDEKDDKDDIHYVPNKEKNSRQDAASNGG